jgi:hypothetical protein
VLTRQKTAVQVILGEYDCDRLGFSYFNAVIDSNNILNVQEIRSASSNTSIFYSILLPKLECGGISSSIGREADSDHSKYTAITSEWLSLNQDGGFCYSNAAECSY